MRRRGGWAWLFALLSGACSEGATPSAPTDAGVAGDALSQERYLDALAIVRRAACRRRLRCSTDLVPSLTSTLNLCVANAPRFEFEPTPSRRAALLDALARGDLSFDADALAACLDALARTCPYDPRLGDVAVSVCATLVHGSAAAGDACRFTESCAPGLRCATRPTAGDAGCESACEPATAGEGCRAHACGTVERNFRGPCATAPLSPPREGGCGSFNGGASGYATCPAGQVCRPVIELVSSCAPLVCDPPCGPDAVCDFERRRCLDAELLGDGAECGSGRLPCDPRRGLFCDPSGRCAPRYGEGHACAGDQCAAGLTCQVAVCRRADDAAPDPVACAGRDL